jgi:serine/threonine protein kinase
VSSLIVVELVFAQKRISPIVSRNPACKKGTSGKLYAMKVMNKRRIKMKKSEQLVWNERQALAAVESNFVVNLKYSFHSKDDIYLILDLMTGGDLGYHLHQKGRFPKNESQYYSCRIILALQALHDQKYVYRDLKPENCLLADDGKVKITDLGLATRITPTLHGAAGTRGYWAPEMLRRDKNGKRMNYGHAVDWFSFGCCLAEFISGSNPFRSEAAYNFGLGRGKQTKEKAIDCATLEMDPEFDPDMFEPDAADLCRRLLDKNEKTRLGAGGCEEIMAHPYFKNMNWESIITDRKKPPFIPAKDVNAGSQSEIGNFTEDKALQETVITAEDDKVYKDWDWLNPQAYATEVIEFLIYERDTGEPLLPITQNASCCCTVL